MPNRPLAGSRRAAVLAALSAVVAAGAGACGEQATPVAARTVIPDSAEQMMFGLRHMATVNGVRRGELLADTALFYDQMTRVEMRGVRAYFFTATGDSSAVMTAREGTYDTRTARVTGRGDVKIVSKDGRELTSPRLVWDRTINQISSDTSFTYRQPGRGEISGIGFRSDPELRNVQVLNAARGTGVVTPGGRR